MWCKKLTLAAAILLAGAAAFAEDLSGKDRFVCAGVEAVVCTTDGTCDEGPAWEWQIPQFVVVDLDDKELATTIAGGENRKSPILNQVREDGQIVLQGVENNRAFSIVIYEADGLASIAIALDGLTISVFGACTPLPVR